MPALGWLKVRVMVALDLLGAALIALGALMLTLTFRYRARGDTGVAIAHAGASLLAGVAALLAGITMTPTLLAVSGGILLADALGVGRWRDEAR